MLAFVSIIALQIAGAAPLVSVEQHRLANGLTVILARDTTTPYVAVESWYPAGTRDDPPAKRGLSHLFEHSFTPRRLFANPANAAARSRFVNSNAQTRRDYTRYYSEVRAQDVALALALHADRMDTPDSLLTDSVVARNVDVVINEGRQGSVNTVEDGPGSFYLLGEFAFAAGHPYAQRPETETTLRAITGQDLRAWLRARDAGTSRSNHRSRDAADRLATMGDAVVRNSGCRFPAACRDHPRAARGRTTCRAARAREPARLRTDVAGATLGAGWRRAGATHRA
jgi:hypothetical protein